MLKSDTELPILTPFDSQRIAEAFAHIETKWPELTIDQTQDDGTLIGLPNPYVIPSNGGNEENSHFAFRELYYWDSYFIIQGLLVSGHDDLAGGILENLLYLFRRFHIIPNSSRFYQTGRSQPPMLTGAIFDIYDKQEKSTAWLNERLDIAEREYKTVWTNDTHPNWRNVFEGLSRYYDINLIDDIAETESGWDMTTRFNDRCLSYIPIDLNCLLYKYEIDFARGATILGDEEKAALWQEHARQRTEKLNQYLWNEEKGFFFDYDYNTSKQSNIWSLAAYYSMWTGMASEEQAARLVANLDKFLHEGGLTATASPTLAQNLAADLPHQWAYPNGWAPLHWIVISGLRSYGYDKEAEAITRIWLRTNLDYFESYGVFREAYNVVNTLSLPQEGLYPAQIGFAWTNAVFIDLSRQFLSSEELAKV